MLAEDAGHAGPIDDVMTSKDDRVLVTVCEADGSIKIYRCSFDETKPEDTLRCTCIETITGLEDTAFCPVSLSPDGRMLLTNGSSPGRFYLRTIEVTAAPTASLRPTCTVKNEHVMRFVEDRDVVTAFAWHPGMSLVQ